MTELRLAPVPHALALAVVHGGDVETALHPLRRARDWPHADSADALRPIAVDPAAAHGTFLILAGDEVIGDCGWIGGPSADGEVEMAYGLAASARRQGRGRAAVRLLCAWVEAQPGVRRITADVHVGNAPSRRLLLGLGFEEEPGVPSYVRYARDL